MLKGVDVLAACTDLQWPLVIVAAQQGGGGGILLATLATQ